MKHPAIDKRVQEIAEFIFANPDYKRKDVSQHFRTLWQISQRTLDKDMATATKKVAKWVSERGEATKAAIEAEITAKVGKSICSRQEILERYSAIARLQPIKSIDENGSVADIQLPTVAESMTAMRDIRAMQGYDAAIKVEADLRPQIQVVNHTDVDITDLIKSLGEEDADVDSNN